MLTRSTADVDSRRTVEDSSKRYVKTIIRRWIVFLSEYGLSATVCASVEVCNLDVYAWCAPACVSIFTTAAAFRRADRYNEKHSGPESYHNPINYIGHDIDCTYADSHTRQLETLAIVFDPAQCLKDDIKIKKSDIHVGTCCIYLH